MDHTEFKTEITAEHRLFDLHLRETYEYRDLILLFVKRNFVSQYKQTILGPAWAIIQPLMTTIVFTFVFGNVAHLADCGVQTVIHYPIPPHRQPAYSEWHGLSLPVTEAIHDTILSLPMSPVMTDDQVSEVVAAVNSWQA